MRVIICDDETSTCVAIEKMLQQLAMEMCMELDIDIFYSGEALAQYLCREKAPEILFLDIELPGMNGVELGKLIRGDLRNSEMFLVYISSKDEYAMELFQNQPFDFLRKPIKKEKLGHIMRKIYDIAGKNSCAFAYKNHGNTCHIKYKDILYFHSDGRKINVVMEKETLSFYGKMAEVEKLCPASLFWRIHKSYMINMHHVKEITYEWMKMINGDVLDISKSYRAMIRRKVMESMSNGF